MDYQLARKSAIYLLRLESLILALILLYLTFELFTATVTVISAAVAEIVFSALGAIGMYFASTGYVKEKSYGRAPAVLANLIALGVSYYMITGKLLTFGIPLALLALATIVCAIAGYRENKN